MTRSASCEQTSVLAAAFFTLAACHTLNLFGCWGEVEKRQWTPVNCGFIFGINELGALIVLFFSVRSVQLYESRVIMHYGIFSIGLSLMIYALVDYYMADPAFYVLAFLCRAVAGVGASLAYLASFVFLLALVPTKVTYFILLLSYGFGLICGSLLGAATGIKDNEFDLIVTLTALTVMCVSFAVPANMPPDRDIQMLISAEDALKRIPEIYLKSLATPPAWISVVVILAASWCFSFVTTSIGPFLKTEAAFSTFDVGWTLSFLFLSAIVTTIVVGIISYRGAPPTVVTTTGLGCLLFGLILLAPADDVNVAMDGPISFVGAVTIGIGFATTIVSICATLQLIFRGEDEHTNTVFGTIVCVVSITYAVGSITGSSLSGVFVEAIGFQNCAYILMAPVILAISLVVVQAMCRRQRTFSEPPLPFAISYGSIIVR